MHQSLRLEDGFPTVAESAVRALQVALADRFEELRGFDNGIWEFGSLGYEEVGEALPAFMYAALAQSREEFLGDVPFGLPLPDDSVERSLEEERRAAERSGVVQRAKDAVQEIVGPIERVHRSGFGSDPAQTPQRPEPQPYGVSAAGAERWVADMVRALGGRGVVVTPVSRDGGIDVLSPPYAISVKHYSGKVPVEELREIYGAAVAAGLVPVLWTLGSLTGEAQAFAELAPVAVVHYHVESGSLQGVNQPARHLLASGFSPVGPPAHRPPPKA